jgi:N-acetylglucosaminyldiphosphoundecaprenol N-acetyl-beta-D-mannosaminyltransferase
MDITPQLLHLAECNQLTVSVYGNTLIILEQFKNFISINFPNIIIGSCISPPFRELTVHEQDKYIDQLTTSGTDILFVSLGCPKQEKWMLYHSHKINGVSLGIGNAINTTIGKEKRPPKFIQKMGLEWLIRLVQNPKRLFSRYLITNTQFCLLLLKLLIKK